MASTARVIGYTTRWSPLVIREVKIGDRIRPSDVVLKLSHIGLNPIDIKLKSVSFIPLHWTVGKDFSGTIEAAGSDSGFRAGERVCGGLLSPFSGFVGTRGVIDTRTHAILRAPANLSDAEACAFPLTFGTAWKLVESANISPERPVLVLGGATNVGSYAIQLLKQRGVKKVVATCSSRSQDFVQGLGADTVDYTSQNVQEHLLHSVVPQKFGTILDTVGGTEALSIWHSILLPASQGGTYATIAGDMAPGKTYEESMIAPTMRAPWIISRLLFGRLWGLNYKLVQMGGGKWVEQASDFFSKPGATIPIDSVTEFENFQSAWDRLNKLQARGKVLLSTS